MNNKGPNRYWIQPQVKMLWKKNLEVTIYSMDSRQRHEREPVRGLYVTPNTHDNKKINEYFIF